jgi:hypothetical protein
MPTGIYPRKSATARFWERVAKDGPIPAHRPDLGPCWVLTKGLRGDGYGRLSVDGRYVMTHRFAYELLVGPIPAGLTIDHLCRNHACANPRHLEPVTRGENCLRGVGSPAANARKTHCKRGHEFTPENTYVHPGRPRHRECVICMRAAEQRRVRRRPSAGHPAGNGHP